MMWLKKLRHRKFQSSIIFLIAFICSVLLASSISIVLSLEKPFLELVAECESPTMYLFPRHTSEEKYTKLKEVVETTEGVARIDTIESYAFNEAITSTGEKIEGYFDLVPYKESVHEKLRYTSEKHLPLEEGECLLPEIVRRQYGLEVGDVMTMVIGDTTYPYRIKAFVVEPYMSSLATSCAFIVGNMPKGIETAPGIFVYGEEGITETELLGAIRRNNGGSLSAGIKTVEDMITFNMITGQILGGVLFGGGLIILLVSCIIIKFLIRNTLLTDLKTIAIYKTIGYSSKAILGMYMKAYLFVTCIGVTLGVMCSSFVSYLFLEQAFESIGAKSGGMLLVPASITYTIMLGVVALSIYSVLKDTRKVSPVAIFANRDNHLGKKRHLGDGKKKYLSFSPFHMAIRAIKNEKKNTFFMILTAVVSMYGVNFAMASMENIDSLSTHNYYWLGFDKSDVFLQSNDKDQFQQVYEALKKDQRVESVIRQNPERVIEIKWSEELGTQNVQGYFFDDLEGLEVPLIEGRNPKYGDEIALTTIVAKDLDKEIGDYVQVMIHEETHSFLLTGIFQSYYGMGSCGRVLGEVWDRPEKPFVYNTLSVYLKEGVDREAFKEDYVLAYGDGLKITNREDMFKSILDMITEPQKKVLVPFMGFIILMGFINIFGIVVLRNLNNQKTNGIYKSIGYESKHLLKVNLWYITMIAVIASSVTLPVFIMTYPKVMALSLMVFGFREYPVFYDVYKLCMMNGVVIVLFLVSSWLSSQSLKHVSVKILGQE